MRAMNRAFVTDSKQRGRIAQVLTAIARAKGPVLIHCAAGKDRTGWVSAMLQEIAGVTKWESIRDQYLLSNTYRDALIKSRVAAARNTSATKAAILGEQEKLRQA